MNSLRQICFFILAFALTVLAQDDPLEAYVFAYFTGNSIEGEKIYLAASNGNDALSWAELNGGQPILTSTMGTKGLRDPFIMRSYDGTTFYVLATDLSIGSGTSWGDSVRFGSRYLEIWESKDLVTWSEQRHVLVSPPNAGNTWAPEAYYDDTIGQYVVFWASSLYEEADMDRTGATYHRMLYSTTTDFVTFSDTQIWQDAGMSRIDSTVIKSDNTFYRFTKDEGASGTGCSDIIQERSSNLRNTLGSWTMVTSCIGNKAGTSAVEGPTVFKSNPGDVHGEKYYLFVDEYGGRGYIPLETADIANPNWVVSSSYALPSSPRHGSVLPITAAERTSLSRTTATRKRAATCAQGVTELADFSLTDPSLLKVPAIVAEEIRQLILAVHPGTDRTSLSPTFCIADGIASSPESAAAVDLSSNVTYTLNKDGSEISEWTFKSVEMRSPVLPGLYADPNIATFNEAYYIYATTDGFDGWGGNDFYVWKSGNLVDWSRSENPILTLDGANGNVPWATGNAWAPTIIERSGKFYFYFSGHNPTYDRKTIGVAVANSPEGPFVAESTAMILNNEALTTGQAIDPATFWDPQSDIYYLFWGNGSPLFAELNDDMLSIKPGTIQSISGLADFREGIFVNFRDGLYHLTYSIDDTGSENYRVGYATSSSVKGPWTYRGVILQKDSTQGILATGHSSILQLPGTDEWVICYHRFAIPNGSGTRRETTIDRLVFGADGLIQPVQPTLTSVET